MHAPQKPLPPGQIEYPTFERFGLGLFARRFPSQPDKIDLSIRGDVERSVRISDSLISLPRVEQVSDFHCVTTWSCRNVRWSGVRFADFYHQLVQPQARPEDGATFVVFRGQDGYACGMHLADLLAPDVLLADGVEGQGLGIEHGAPLRLVAPAHYGYKNVKHIAAIEFWRDRRNYRFPFPYPQLMDHPRGRVAFEERARYLPMWLIRLVYRALIPGARRKMKQALEAYRAAGERRA